VAAGERRGHQARTVVARSLAVSAPASTAPLGRPASTGAQRSEWVVGRPVRVPDAPLPLMRLLTERRPWPADERDALSVRGPRGAGVVIDARRQELYLARAHVVDADERVVHTIGDEGELRSVGRPLHIAIGAPRFDPRDLSPAHR